MSYILTLYKGRLAHRSYVTFVDSRCKCYVLGMNSNSNDQYIVLRNQVYHVIRKALQVQRTHWMKSRVDSRDIKNKLRAKRQAWSRLSSSLKWPDEQHVRDGLVCWFWRETSWTSNKPRNSLSKGNIETESSLRKEKAT